MIVCLVLIVGLCIFIPFFRCALFHPVDTPRYGIPDLYHYFRWKLYNKKDMGKIVAINGYFGSGKTLTAVWLARRFATATDGKKYYDCKRGSWITNRVVVLSNVSIQLDKGIYVFMEKLQDFVSFCTEMKDYDNDNNTRTYVYCIIDECGSNLNSRNFKDNFCDFDFVNTMLTSRHYNASIYWIAQKYNLCDKLLRDVTADVYQVHKLWRLCYYDVFDALEVENAVDTKCLKRKGRRLYFATDKLYGSYDTISVCDKLQKDATYGFRYTAHEIMENRGVDFTGMDRVSKPSRKWRKSHK